MLKRLWTWMKADDGQSGMQPVLRRRIFWVALGVRILYILIAHTYRVRVLNDHFQFAWEIGRISRALATGYGYADPFAGHTGPTAWSPPLYPLLLAGVFKVFGVYTALSAFVILSINSIFSAAIAPAVHEIADRCYDSHGFGRRVALWSGWAWALYPAAAQYAVHWIWEMSLTTCAFAWILVIALRVRGIGDPTEKTPHNATGLWAAFGLLWGIICLSNPSIVFVLPAAAIWMLCGQRASLKTGLSRAVLAGVIFTCCLTPWIYRNWKVFHAFIPTRGNLGAEVYQSMLPSHMGFPWGTTIPAVEQDPEFQRYRRMGELAYVRERGEQGNELIRDNKGVFAGYTLKRIYFFWVSVPHPVEKSVLIEATREMNYFLLSLTGLLGLALSLRRRVPAAGLFAWVFVLLPIPYYLLTVQARFRHPLEPLITIFTVFLFQSTTPRTAKRVDSTSLSEQTTK